MTATLQLSGNPLGQRRSTPLAPCAGVYEDFLSDFGYAPSTKGRHFRCLVHFGRWMSECGLKPITFASNARQQPAGRCSCVPQLPAAGRSAPTASARRSARPAPAPDCPTAVPTCCAIIRSA
jgi:hypothetical protein